MNSPIEETTTATIRHREGDVARSGEEISGLLNEASKLPRTWVIVMSFVAAVATIDIDRAVNGGIQVGFEVDQTALIALALIWLPMLQRVFAMAGGSFKAGGMEANMHGVLSQPEAIELLTMARQVETATSDEERRRAAQALEESIDRVTASTLGQNVTMPDSVLAQLARSYEKIRLEMQPGGARTSAMSRIVNEARVRATADPHVAATRGLQLLGSRSQGDRIIGLALTQEARNPEALDDALSIVSGSETAYEMYHALLAIQGMALSLSKTQRARAAEVLKREQNDPRGVGVSNDSGLASTLRRTISILDGTTNRYA